MSSEITWGDTVIVAAIAPLEFRPGERGSVAGFRESEQLSEKGGVSKDSKLVLVEFSNGEAIEIPDRYLVKSLES
jgi:hypothetical protein